MDLFEGLRYEAPFRFFCFLFFMRTVYKVSAGSFLLQIFQKFVAPGWRASLSAAIFDNLLCLIGPRKKVALENMKNTVFPDSEEWRQKTLAGVYRHIAWMLAEYLVLVKDPSSVLDWVVEVEGEHILEQLVQEKKGAIILTGHLGNWELLAAWLCQKGYPLYAVVRDPDDKDVAKLIESYRCRVGLRTLKKKSIMKESVRLAQNGAFLGLLSDQDGGHTGLPSLFLGKECSTVNGPAAISLMAHVPIVPVISYRIAPFRHQIIISSPLTFSGVGKKKEQLESMTRSVDMTLEKMVIRHPEQWLWLHRRWRSRFP